MKLFMTRNVDVLLPGKQGGSRGAGARPPLFLAKSVLFITLYTMSEKNIFEIEF